ncbi:hypothetical protein [Agrococcus sp. ProA11]|uniref:hypothetical protein n=1 Tax=Agrococcus chionoecetis TaxID=3153752 RepID=UPI003260E57C
MDRNRNRRLEDWVELAAAAVERSRRSIGADEVARRVEASVSDEDYDTVVRVLRTMGRDLQSTGADLTALDERLRASAHVEHHPHVPETPEDAATHDQLVADVPEQNPEQSVEQNPEPTLRDLPGQQRSKLTPAQLALQLARLRNPILPHPGRGRRA